MRSNWHHLVVIMALAACVAPPPEAPSAPEPRPSPEATAALPASGPWPGVLGCRELATALAALPVAERARLDPSDAPLGVTFRMADGLPSGGVTGDLPLPPDDQLRRCALIVESDASAPAAPRRMLAHERVRSVYRASAAGRANPEHRRLQAELRDIEQDEGPEILATGDPGLDLIGLVAGSVLDGISTALEGQRARALRERMAATPARLEEVTWEPYGFEVATVEASRSGKVRAVLVDRASGDAFPLEETVVETRRFRVAQGRRARDRGLLEGGGDGLVDLEDVAVWEQAGIRPGVTALLAVLPAQPATSANLPGAVEATLFGSSSVVAEVGSDGVRRFRLGSPTTAPGLGPDHP
jgi:hypothetical protein